MNDARRVGGGGAGGKQCNDELSACWNSVNSNSLCGFRAVLGLKGRFVHH